MKPIYDKLSRRQFLRGTGGALLAIPLLPSLLPRAAEAQAVGAASAERYFVHMTTWHGCFQEPYFGSLLNATPTATTSHGGISVRSAPLPFTTESDQAVLSSILRARSSLWTPRLRGLTNVINGLDFARGTGHNRGGTLGGVADVAPTLDQLLAEAPSFYRSAVAQPAIVRNLVSLARRSGSVVQTEESADSNVKLFDRLFKGTSSTGGTPAPAPEQVVLVDRVKEHADLVLSDPSCSADCRSRLGDYLDMLSQVEAKVQASAGVSSDFTRPTTDTLAVERSAGFYGAPATQVQCEQLWNDIVVAAFAAGISRVYVCGPTTYTFGPEPEHSWHNAYAHGQDDPTVRAGFGAAVQRQFEGALLDMASKLDRVRTADGATLLDKGLVASGFELGSGGNPGHHHNRCIPVVSIGNAGGYFRTGQSLDYRDLNGFSWSSDPHWWGGLLYDQWLGMVVRAMGVSQADFDSTRYGYPGVRADNTDHTDAMWAAAGTNLPWLKA
ncbi:hypothetical protein [Variovorax sp. YR752]|uniref:hypothetical protein n=1 Tax=Variovorax sp. YR752 TaxID=1884383 RepID=UPI0031377C84